MHILHRTADATAALLTGMCVASCGGDGNKASTAMGIVTATLPTTSTSSAAQARKAGITPGTVPYKGKPFKVLSAAQAAAAARRAGVSPASVGACNVLSTRDASAALGVAVKAQGAPLCGYTPEGRSISEFGAIAVMALKATPPSSTIYAR